MNQHKMTLFSSATFAAFVLGATVLSGCGPASNVSTLSGGPEDTTTGSGSGQSGHEYFVTTVFPKLSNCVNCHGNGTGPQFLAGGAEGAYSTIKANKTLFKADSPILSHGKHTGPALESGQATVVQQWLSLEDFSSSPTTPSNGGDEEGGITMGQLVQEFIRCMDHDVWIKSKMPEFSKVQTVGFGACAGCHQTGNAGTFISYDPDVTFANSRAEPYVYRYIIAHYDDDGHIDGLVPSTRLIDKANATKGFDSKDDRYIHPPYVLDLDEANAPLQFSSTIISRLDPKTHVCTQPHDQN